ncbi:MAG: CPBP family glutamic-type intramembrane protease, partial [Salinisphaera sp.]|nr:CPBP family glutamic-type intramembrane protease [Salinisphaera sp.]
QYLKYYPVFHAVLAWTLGPADASMFLRSTWGNLAGNLWWGAIHLLGYVLVPVIVIRVVLRQRLRDYGLGWSATHRYAGWYLALAAPIVFFAFLVSYTPAFQHTYPFYRFAGRSWADLLAWEVIYLAQFAFLEFFFRGFLLHAMARAFGAVAIFIMAVPYLMIHFTKPWPEAFGALAFGILLGILSLRSGSIWGGASVHMTVALSMDLMALAQENQWPGQLWP